MGSPGGAGRDAITCDALRAQLAVSLSLCLAYLKACFSLPAANRLLHSLVFLSMTSAFPFRRFS